MNSGFRVAEIEQALDRCLPAFSAQNQLRAFKREIQRLEDLSSEFFTIAKRDLCRDSAHLVARLNERIASMRGWSSVSVRLDPLAAQAHEQPSRHDRIREVIMRLTRPEQFQQQPNGGDGQQPNGGDGSPPD